MDTKCLSCVLPLSGRKIATRMAESILEDFRSCSIRDISVFQLRGRALC